MEEWWRVNEDDGGEVDNNYSDCNKETWGYLPEFWYIPTV